MTTLFLIPARGGSKSIPLKNLFPLNGRPLIDYSCQIGLALREFGPTALSTDSQAIYQYCHSTYPEIIPIQRPLSLAQDNSPVVSTVNHALSVLSSVGHHFDYICLLQPTSPFLSISTVHRLLLLLDNDKSLGSAQSITPLPHNHHFLNQRSLDESSSLTSFFFTEERLRAYRKQDKPPTYRFANCLITRVSKSKVENLFMDPSISIVVSSPLESMDVDTISDFQLSELLLANQSSVYRDEDI